MLLQESRSEISQPCELPGNLGEGFGSREFLALIYEAVQSVEQPREARQQEAGQLVSSAVLRTLITYCYAVGIYSSHEIENAALADPSIRYICAHQRPTWPIIRRFRRQNLNFLRKALRAVCGLVLDRRPASPAPAIPAHSQERSASPCPLDFTREVEARLRKAMQADSMALDE